MLTAALFEINQNDILTSGGFYAAYRLTPGPFAV
jgi:hypothetical protein